MLPLIALVAGVWTFSSPVWSATPIEAGSSNDAKLSALNCQIIHKEIELEKSNARFLMNSHPEGRWKAWRYFAFQESGGAVLEAGLIAGMADRYRQLDHGGKIRGALLEDALLPQAIGQLIAASGDVVELGLNARLAFRAKREGRDGASSKRIALGLRNELLVLLEKRETLLKEVPELRTPMSALETKILRDEERLVWLQYSRSLQNARKLAATENTFYALDILKNVTGAAGNIVGIVATHRQHPRLNIGANTLTTASGFLIMTNPITSRIAGKIVAKKHSKDLEHHFRRKLDEVVGSLTKNSEALTMMYENPDAQNGPFNRVLSARVNLYSKQVERAGRFVEEQKRRDRRANTGALNTMAVAAFVGATKVATGTCGIVAADGLSGHAGAAVLLGGTTAYAVGTDVGLVDNARINIVRERRFQTQRKNASSANELLAREINDLEKLDRELSRTEDAQSVR